MTRTWLSNNEEMENVLLSNGIHRHLGWDQISQVADWAVVSHKQAQVHLQAQITRVQAYIETLEKKPATRRPMTQIHGISWDEAIKRAVNAINWETACVDMARERWSLEFAREVQAMLNTRCENPDLPIPVGLQDEPLWLAVGSISVLMAVVPRQLEGPITAEVHSTGKLRTFPWEVSGLSAERLKSPPDTHPVESLIRILPQHRLWVLSNLSAGAALLGDLVRPVSTSQGLGAGTSESTPPLAAVGQGADKA